MSRPATEPHRPSPHRAIESASAEQPCSYRGAPTHFGAGPSEACRRLFDSARCRASKWPGPAEYALPCIAVSSSKSLARSFQTTFQPFRHSETAVGWVQLALAAAALVLPAGIAGTVVARVESARLGLGTAVVIAVLVFAVLVTRALLVTQRDLDESRDAPRSYLTFETTEVAQAHVSTGLIALGAPVSSPLAAQALTATGPSIASQSVAVPVADFARVQVSNSPPVGQRGQLAPKVAARITFARTDGTELVSRMIGRWAETPQRIESGRLGLSLDEAQLDIDCNGLPHPLDVAMKYPGDEDCYAYNFENSVASDLRVEGHRLRGSEFRVTVLLRAADNADPVEGHFILRNHGRGRSVELVATTTGAATP